MRNVKLASFVIYLILFLNIYYVKKWDGEQKMDYCKNCKGKSIDEWCQSCRQNLDAAQLFIQCSIEEHSLKQERENKNVVKS